MPLEITEAVKKEIQNEELDCTDGVANTFLRGLICSKILKNLQKNWALNTYIKQRSILTKITRFISIITSSGYLIGKKIEKILHLVVETILKEWPEQE